MIVTEVNTLAYFFVNFDAVVSTNKALVCIVH